MNPTHAEYQKPRPGHEVPRVILGREAYPNDRRARPDIIVIGDVSPSGNTIIRVGHVFDNNPESWERVAHVVLTPAERETLIAKLIEQRS